MKKVKTTKAAKVPAKKVKRKTLDRETPVAVPMQELVVEENYGAKPARASAAITCKFCKHDYLKPCKDDKAKAKCRNWQHLQESK